MKKALLIVPLVIFISAAYYLYINSPEKKEEPTSTVAPQLTPMPTPAPTAPTTPDEEIIPGIIQGFVTKYKRPAEEIVLTIDEKDATHAKGSIRFKDEMGGALWFGAFDQGKWVLVSDGQGPMDCALVDKYDFPKTMVSGCIDISNGDKFIER